MQDIGLLERAKVCAKLFLRLSFLLTPLHVDLAAKSWSLRLLRKLLLVKVGILFIKSFVWLALLGFHGLGGLFFHHDRRLFIVVELVDHVVDALLDLGFDATLDTRVLRLA